VWAVVIKVDAGAEAQLLSQAFFAALEALRHPKSTAARQRSRVNIKVKGSGQSLP